MKNKEVLQRIQDAHDAARDAVGLLSRAETMIHCAEKVALVREAKYRLAEAVRQLEPLE